MESRIANPAQLLDANKAIGELYKSVYNGGVSPAVLELVHLRASQINGCSPCVDSGVKGMRKQGESEERIALVGAWREAPYYTEEERAALELAEEATRMADKPGPAVTDATWDAAAQFFDDKQLAAIVMMVAVTNLFNRLNGPTRQIAGQAW
jgi:AhpD family alkylhydroperoxidase